MCPFFHGWSGSIIHIISSCVHFCRSIFELLKVFINWPSLLHWKALPINKIWAIEKIMNDLSGAVAFAHHCVELQICLYCSCFVQGVKWSLPLASSASGPPDAWWTRGQKSLHWVVPFSIQYKVEEDGHSAADKVTTLFHHNFPFFLIYRVAHKFWTNSKTFWWPSKTKAFQTFFSKQWCFSLALFLSCFRPKLDEKWRWLDSNPRPFSYWIKTLTSSYLLKSRNILWSPIYW